MNDAAIRAALIAWVAAITGIAPGLVLWVDAKRPFVAGGVCALLERTPARTLGTDQIVYDHDAVDPVLDADDVPGDLLPAVTGMREFTLQLAVESFDFTTPAMLFLERARRRMRWPTHLATLRAGNLALVSATNITVANYKADQRQVSRAVLDVILATALDERLVTPSDRDAAIPYIATIGVTSDLENPDGNPVGTPPQFADLEMP